MDTPKEIDKKTEATIQGSGIRVAGFWLREKGGVGFT